MPALADDDLWAWMQTDSFRLACDWGGRINGDAERIRNEVRP